MPRIGVGAKIPNGMLFYIDAENKVRDVSVHSLAAEKKIVIFGVPGAFTPVCSQEHVPKFVEKAMALKAKGVDDIICISVNDPYVMNKWASSYPTNKHVKFLSDGAANYTHSLGLELDLTDTGLGIRSQRYALICDNLEVKIANIEGSGTHLTSQTVSSAENILKATSNKEPRLWIHRVMGKRGCIC